MFDRQSGKARAEQFQRRLFDLKTDLAETKDLSAKHPETVLSLECC